MTLPSSIRSLPTVAKAHQLDLSGSFYAISPQFDLQLLVISVENSYSIYFIHTTRSSNSMLAKVERT
jgi:hypothetical protein